MGNFDDMRYLALLLLCVLSGCATSVVSAIGPDGRFHSIARIQGDGPFSITYQNRYNRVTFVTTGLNHSAATLAWGTAGAAIGGVVAQDIASWFAHLSFSKP
jgi:hypothetical protein